MQQLKTARPRLRLRPRSLAAAVAPAHVLRRRVHAGYQSHDQKLKGSNEGGQGRDNDSQFAHPGNPTEWKDAYYESQLRLEMMNRPRRRTWDYLSPTPTSLLDLALDDFLPRDARPSHFRGWLGRRTAAASAAAAAAANGGGGSSSSDDGDGETLIPRRTTVHLMREGASPLMGPRGAAGGPTPLPTLHRPGSSSSLLDPTPLPQGHHLVYFPPQLSDQELLPDGTDPAHWPGLPFTRRLWAGGSVTYARGWERSLRFNRTLAPMWCDESVQHVELRLQPPQPPRQSTAEEEEEQQQQQQHDGAPPGKVTVTLSRRYGFDGSRAAVISETRNLVFMRDHPPGEGPRMPPSITKTTTTTVGSGETTTTTTTSPPSPPLMHRRKPDYSFEMTPSRRLLFHFSALSHNAHLIHLDPAHALAEGHRAPLVHGPLTLVLMHSALRAHLGHMGAAVRSIQYRNLAPLYADEPLRVCVRRVEAADSQFTYSVWIETLDGRPGAKGTAVSYLVDQDMLCDMPRR
ncbi:hypothetical protein GGTG_09566 [Gaeumannomyces tritici R3-111a-1]|uniref:MaoC-like domain-containing protein n=1 Tax=Gaeumannomyces tritici (strain R3-111a-1) TaxID=644352 RepID=J3P7S4_GAET3|nr:hypothetical protein GGTG_09566 [Gaeumannomyces tritici R3-111a-1]EJT72707.1 hypothetical protein GGTG_09566 [Gaeumannomyces tritici R3-111a-1]